MSERVVVTLGEEWLNDPETAAEELRRSGMRVEQVLDQLGVVLGSLSEADAEQVRGLPGVVAVEAEGSFGIP
ncbi:MULTISPECIES: hypothetical protein [unclassified Actinopolyspora]|uniref:hypothetical protein n=1 Tax=Actinopolyspora TaxID=1849 RepID=UPI0013F64827|nr:MULTISPECIES: hypothetical protein [unclassified Actinopolyspora]NHD15835.1 hypothetical protein [Actinopolyspora sp. BKK2]NHE74951.1 hypothetical protein [Actinopolyspora sp. BKK1]